MALSDSDRLSKSLHQITSKCKYIVLQTNAICLCGSVSWVIITSSSCFQKLMASMVSKLGFFTRKSKDSWYSCWENQEPFRCFRIFALCALVLVFVSPGATTAMFTKSDDGGMQEWEASYTSGNETRDQCHPSRVTWFQLWPLSTVSPHNTVRLVLSPISASLAMTFWIQVSTGALSFGRGTLIGRNSSKNQSSRPCPLRGSIPDTVPYPTQIPTAPKQCHWARPWVSKITYLLL